MQDSKQNRDCVRAFAQQMIAELEANANKGHWGEMTPYDLGYELMDHVTKLIKAMYPYALNLGDEHDWESISKTIIEKAADIANFAMFAAVIYGDLEYPAPVKGTTYNDDVRAMMLQTLEAVQEMRTLQREYFKTRDQDVLAQCKAKEKLVDSFAHTLIPVLVRLGDQQ